MDRRAERRPARGRDRARASPPSGISTRVDPDRPQLRAARALRLDDPAARRAPGGRGRVGSRRIPPCAVREVRGSSTLESACNFPNRPNRPARARSARGGGGAVRRGRERGAGRARHGPPRAGRAALGRPPPGGGHARHRQDAARQVARGRDRRPLRPGAVHPRPAARRRHRHLGVRPGDRRLGLPARPDLRERRARRRGEPRVAAHPGRVARADGGAPGHGRRRDAPAAGSVLRRRDPEPVRQRGHLPAARRASSTGSRSCARSGCRAAPPSARSSTARAVSTRSTTLAPVTCPAELAATIAAVRGVHCAHTVRDYVLDVADATRNHPGIVLGASPRASLGLLRAAQAHATVMGRDFVSPDDVKQVAPGRARAPHRARRTASTCAAAGWPSARSSARSSRRARDRSVIGTRSGRERARGAHAHLDRALHARRVRRRGGRGVG